MIDPVQKILFSANLGYSQLLLTAVKSLLRCSKDPSKISLTVVDRGIPGHYRQLLEIYASDAGASLDLVCGQLSNLKKNLKIPLSFFDLPDTGHYDRILAPFLIDGSKALYLDADLLIQEDLSALWESDMNGFPIGAVQDQNIPTIGSSTGIVDWQEFGFNEQEAYFNSGVMLMDLDQWRSKEFASSCIECALNFFERHNGPPPLNDQYALNVILYKNWESLPVRWNTFAERIQDLSTDPAIVHFAGSHKPFRRLSKPPPAIKYFVRIVQKMMHEDFVHVEETAECLERLRSHHQIQSQHKVPLLSPNKNPVSFADSIDLASAPDEGIVAIVMPVMIDNPKSLRFENFCFLVQYYYRHIPFFVIVEQVHPDSESPVGRFLSTLNCSSIHHFTVECEDRKIHKSSLINRASSYCFSKLGARYVWQLDADIYLNIRAVINQLRVLNSKSIPVIRPLLYFIRLNSHQSEELKATITVKLGDFAIPGQSLSFYQIIDLFGPGTLIFSKEAFRQTGGMDESYKGWGWEDMDFAERLAQFKVPHTLPLIGFHLHHEEDRAPHFDNFDEYCKLHHPNASKEEIDHILVHTIFHNFLSKFSIVSLGDTKTVCSTFGEVQNEKGEVLFKEAPIDPHSLPRNQAMAPSMSTRIVYSLASKTMRKAGFHWDVGSPIMDPVSRQSISPEKLIDFMVSSGFRILLVVDENGGKGLTDKLIEKRFDAMIGIACDHYHVMQDEVYRRISLREIDSNPEALAQCLEHLQIS